MSRSVSCLCRLRDLNSTPTKHHLPSLAEFLTFLFETRGVAPSTMTGLSFCNWSHVLRLSSGYDPGEDDITSPPHEELRPTEAHLGLPVPQVG